jgi:hypothetical protein
LPIYGVDVTFRLRGKGEVRHFNLDGTVWDDMRKGVVRQGKHGSSTYEFDIMGVSTWTYRASDSRAFYKNNKTSGRDILKINGSVDLRRQLTNGSTPEEYLCSGTILSVQDGAINREYMRVSSTPAPTPKL